MDITGEPLIQRLATYRYVSGDSSKKVSNHLQSPESFPDTSSLDTSVVHFPVSSCAMSVLTGTSAPWNGHTIPLQQLTPEFLLTDLPDGLMLRPELLKFSASNKTLLGRGGAGAVYRASYDSIPIAMKQFSASVSGNLESSLLSGSSREILPADDYAASSFEALQAGEDAMALLRQLRQEVTVLKLLKHSCVVRLIGVQLHPIAFALELAPLGSLFDIMEKRLEKLHGIASNCLHGPVFGHMLTQRVLMQVRICFSLFAHVICLPCFWIWCI